MRGRIVGMSSNVAFGIIAILLASVSGSILIGGWIYLIYTHGLVEAVASSFSSQVPIVQQAVWLTVTLVFGVGGASLLATRK